MINGYLFGPKFRPYRRGDIVISKSKVDPSKNVCKRIAALPGDIVVSLNDNPISRHVIKDIVDENATLPPKELAKLLSQWTPHVVVTEIQPGRIWLAGDNPNNSFDSRNYGPAKLDDILGRVSIKIFEQYYKSFFKTIKTENFGRSEHPALVIVYNSSNI